MILTADSNNSIEILRELGKRDFRRSIIMMDVFPVVLSFLWFELFWFVLIEDENW